MGYDLKRCWKCGKNDLYNDVGHGLCLACFCKILNRYLMKKRGTGGDEATNWAFGQTKKAIGRLKIKMEKEKAEKAEKTKTKAKNKNNRRKSEK